MKLKKARKRGFCYTTCLQPRYVRRLQYETCARITSRVTSHVRDRRAIIHTLAVKSTWAITQSNVTRLSLINDHPRTKNAIAHLFTLFYSISKHRPRRLFCKTLLIAIKIYITQKYKIWLLLYNNSLRKSHTLYTSWMLLNNVYGI